MRVLLAGPGAFAALSSPSQPAAWWRFSGSVVVQVSRGVVVLVRAGAPLGPLEAVVDELPGPGVSPGTLDLHGVPRWRGVLPEPARLAPVLGIAREAAALAAEGSLVPAGRWAAAAGSLAAGDLGGAAGVLGGAGPGLTPAGDDALCGLFFALRARRGAAAEAWLGALASSVETTRLSSAALHWAALGQALAPAHDLLSAAARGDAAAAGAAARALARVGHSSGADLARGLAAGLAWAGADLPAGTPGYAGDQPGRTLILCAARGLDHRRSKTLQIGTT